jgi:hypothetical protein
MIALDPALAFAFSDALLVITFICSRAINAWTRANSVCPSAYSSPGAGVRYASKRLRSADTRVTTVSVTIASVTTFMPPLRIGAASGANGRLAPIAGSREMDTRPAWLCISIVSILFERQL